MQHIKEKDEKATEIRVLTTIGQLPRKTSQLVIRCRCNACGEVFKCTDIKTANELLCWWNYCPICGRRFDNL